MHLSINNQDLEVGLKIIDDFVCQHDDNYLNEVERAIIHGSLSNLTYQVMEQTEPALRNYNVDYIARNLAFDLWHKLTLIVIKSPLIEKKFKVGKKKLWHLVNKLIEKIGHNYQVTSDPPDDLEGKFILDRYQVDEYLFDRDSGERHFLARDRHLGDKPCLVIQRRHQTAKIRRKFNLEAKVLSELGKHPQLPQLLAYFEEVQCLNLVYEHIPGIALTKLLTAKTWQEEQAKSLLKNLLNVLKFIHKNQVVHRNLNPDTIIQTEDRWVLIDFATVKEMNHFNDSISQSTFAQGMTGYMPAEQMMGMTNYSSDIYAVGMIIVHCLTGIHPRKLKIDSQTGNIIWRNQAQVSNSLADIIDRCINYHFCDRYQSAKEMLEDLKSLPTV